MLLVALLVGCAASESVSPSGSTAASPASVTSTSEPAAPSATPFASPSPSPSPTPTSTPTPAPTPTPQPVTAVIEVPPASVSYETLAANLDSLYASNPDAESYMTHENATNALVRCADATTRLGDRRSGCETVVANVYRIYFETGDPNALQYSQDAYNYAVGPEGPFYAVPVPFLDYYLRALFPGRDCGEEGLERPAPNASARRCFLEAFHEGRPAGFNMDNPEAYGNWPTLYRVVGASLVEIWSMSAEAALSVSRCTTLTPVAEWNETHGDTLAEDLVFVEDGCAPAGG